MPIPHHTTSQHYVATLPHTSTSQPYIALLYRTNVTSLLPCLGLSTVPRTCRIYGARMTGPVPVPSKQSGYRLYGRFCTVYVRASEILREYHWFESEHAYPCSFDTLPHFAAIIGGIEGG